DQTSKIFRGWMNMMEVTVLLRDMNNSIDLNVSEQPDSQEIFEPFSNKTMIPKGSKSKHASGSNTFASQDLDQETHTLSNQRRKQKIPKETPLPKMIMFVLSVIVFSEPMNSTILFPFIYFMVRDFGVSKDEKEIGRYAGLIASSFFLAQFCFAIFWGVISDRIGRRPILLIGLLGNVVTCLFFGLSKSLIWAIASRATCGMLNANVGVAKSMLGELTDRTNQTKAFSLFGFCWGFGPITGGYLSNPVDHFPGIFGNCVFLKQYPYFLPCAVAACISFTGFVIGFFMLPETRFRKVSTDPEQIPFLPSNKKIYGSVITSNEIGDNNSGKISIDDIRSVTSNDVIGVDKSSTNQQKIIVNSGISTITYIVIASYAIICFHTIIVDEVYSIYSVTAIKDGGLGFGSSDLALTLAFMGVVQLTCQFLIYPHLRRLVDTVKMYQMSLIAYVLCYCIFPSINLLQRKLIEREIAPNINNSASSDVLGTVNGIGQTSASLTRALGPALGGFLWSWSLTNNLSFPFDYFFIYIIISAATFIGWIQSFNIPSELGYLDDNLVKISE
ncbi:7225_t:CDS:2, partial [Cetraspora pellucida]